MSPNDLSSEPANEVESEAASCCAAFYEQDWVHTLLGESFHPGGPALSARLFETLALPKNARILDVACGTGTTALAMAKRADLQVVGLDFSAKNAAKANERAKEAGVEKRVQFQAGDAAQIPFDNAIFDAVICECAVSTFVDKEKVAQEFRRVLKSGGQVAISDMVLDGALPGALAQAAGPWACLQDALDVAGYQRLFLDAGLLVTSYRDESAALRELASDLKRRLLLAGFGQMAGALPGLTVDVNQARALLDAARDEVDAGRVQYCALTFSLGVPNRAPDAVKNDVAEVASSDAPCCAKPSAGCC